MTASGISPISRSLKAQWRRRTVAALSGALLAMPFISVTALAAPSGNLTSTQHSVSAPNTQPVSIVVGGAHQTVTPGQMITPAELAAVNQVLTGGTQSLIIGVTGNATGGRLALTAGLQSLANLTVPHGVTTLANFTGSTSFSLAGDLTNSGRFVAFTNTSGVTNGIVNAANIYNLLGGTITSTNGLNLSLNAAGVINNAGTISSTGALSLSAGTSIINSLAGATSKQNATITGATGVNLFTTDLVNSGSIVATAGNINIASAASIQMNNAGGTLQAASGAINIRDASFAGTGDFTLNGGDILSNSLNIYSGCGTANVNAGNITGLVNANAGAIHVTAAAPNLRLGSMNISGDPTFFNTSGDVTLTANLLFAGQALTIVAARNVISTATLAIDTSTGEGPGGTGDAGKITIIAGALAVANPVVDASTTSTTLSAGNLTVLGASGMGGKIDLATHGSSAINSSTQAASSNGGDVTLLAFGGTNGSSGTISVGAITTGSGSGGNAGNVTIIGGAHADPSTGSAIAIGLVDTSSGQDSVGGGNVVVRTSTPVVTAPLVFQPDGTLVGGGSFVAGATQHASLNVADVTTNAAPVTLIAGKDINYSGPITTNGGNVNMLAGHNINSSQNINTSSASGLAGNVLLAAGINILPGTHVDDANIAGTSVTGGSVAVADIDTNEDTVGGTNGGNVTIVAGGGTDVSSGTVTASNISTSGHIGGGTSGNILVIAGAEGSTGNQTAINLPFLSTLGTGVTPTGTGNITVVGGPLVAGSVQSPISFQSGVLNGTFSAAGTAPTNISLGFLASAGGVITVTAGGDLGVALIFNSGFGTDTQVNLTAGGVMTLASNIIVSAATASSTLLPASGGMITLVAGSFVPAGPSRLIADGTGGRLGIDGGDSGVISVTSTSAAANVTIASGGGAAGLNLSALADTGVAVPTGGVSVTSGANIVVSDSNAIAVSGTGTGIGGGSITLQAGTGGKGTVVVDGILSADAGDNAGTAQAGSINITVNTLSSPKSPSPFEIGAATTPIRGGVQGLSANGPMGSVSVTNLGTGGIQIVDQTSIISGTNGSVTIDAVSGPIIVSDTTTGHTLAANNGGETVNLNAQQFVFNSGAFLSIDASNSANTALNGGTINITSTASKQSIIVLGSSVTTGGGFTLLDVHGVAAGAINISAGANIKVDPTGLNLTTTTSGGSLALSAGTFGSTATGLVLITNSLDLSGKGTSIGGQFTVSENSSKVFTVGAGALSNGVSGTVDISGGTASLTENFSVTNRGGGISLSSVSGNPSVNVLTTNTSGNSGDGVSLNALKGNVSVGFDINVNGDGSGSGGAVTLFAPAGAVFVNGGILAAGGGAGGAGGFVNITTSSSKPFMVGGATGISPSGTNGSIDVSGASGGTLFITNNGSGGILANSGALSLAASSGGGASVVFIAAGGGNVVISNGGLGVIGTGTGDGGLIQLTAPKGVVFVSGGLTADSSAGNGGQIYITSNSASPFEIASATNSGKGKTSNGTTDNISASGFDTGGEINITNLGAGGIFSPPIDNVLSVFGQSSSGTMVLDAAKGPARIEGTLNVGAPGTGSAGQISVISNSAKPFVIGASLLDANGIVGGLQAESHFGSGGLPTGLISVTNLGAGGITVKNGLSIAVDNSGGGAAGTVKLQAPNGIMALAGGQSLDVSGGLGVLRLVAKSFVVTSAGSGNFSLRADGGQTSSNAQNAGEISIYSTAANKSISIGSGAGQISIEAKATDVDGNGGIVKISSGANIEVDGDGTAGSGGSLNLLPNLTGGGASVTLIAGTAGAGIVTSGGLNVNSGANDPTHGAGTINIITNSSTPFQIGGILGKVPNGVSGNLSASDLANNRGRGGSIGVKNLGTGGINITSLDGDISVGASGDGGIIDLEAPKGTLAIPNGNLSANSGSSGAFGFNGGSITLNAQTIKIASGGLTLNADSLSTVNGLGGTISVTQTGITAPLGLSSVNGATNTGFNFSAQGGGSGNLHGTASFTSAGGIRVDGAVGNSGTDVVLSVSGKGRMVSVDTVTPGIVVAGSLTLNSGTGDIGAPDFSATNVLRLGSQPNFVINANNLNVSSGGGSVFITNVSTNQLFIDTVSQAQSANFGKIGQSVSIGSQGAINLVGSINAPAATVNLVSGTDATVGGDITLSSITASIINVSVNQGQVTQSGGIIGGSNAKLIIVTQGGGVTGLNTAVSSLTISGVSNGTLNGSIGVTNMGSMTIDLSHSSPSNITVSAFGSITFLADPVTHVSLNSGDETTIQTLPGSNGSILLNGTATTLATFTVTLDGAGSLMQSKPAAVISAGQLTLSSGTGNLGSNSVPLSTSTLGLSATTGGAGTVNISNSGKILNIGVVSTGGNVTISNDQTVTTNDNIVGPNVGLNSLIQSQNGSVNITTSSGTLAIGVGSSVFAGAGVLQLQSTDQLTGTIDLGPGASLIANGPIHLYVGATPDAPTQGNAPGSNVTAVGSSIFWGPSTADIFTAAPQNLVDTSGGGTVVFNNTGTFPHPIQLSGGVAIVSNATPAIVTSLDLTSKAAVIALRNTPGVTVPQTLTNGTIIIQNTVNLTSLTALNIPANVTVQLVGFDKSTPIGLNLLAGAPVKGAVATKSATITGTLEFVGDSTNSTTTAQSNPTISISSTIPGQVLNIVSSGKVSSDANLTLNVGGNVTLAGKVTAPGSVTLNATLGNNLPVPNTSGLAGGSVTISGNLLSTLDLLSFNGSITVNSTGSILQIGGLVKANFVSLNVSGSNSLNQTRGGLEADAFNFTSGTLAMTFGPGKNGLEVNSIVGSSLAGALSSVNLLDSRQLDLTMAAGGALKVATRELVSESQITGSSIVLNVGGIVLGANANISAVGPFGTLSVVSTGTGVFNLFGDVSNSSSMNSNGAISISAKSDVDLELMNINSSIGNVTVNTTGNLTVASASVTGGLAVTMTANKAVNLGGDVNTILIAQDGDMAIRAGGLLNLVPQTSAPLGLIISTGAGNIILSSKSGIKGSLDSGSVSIEAQGSGTMVTNIVGGGVDLLAGPVKGSLTSALNLSPGTLPLPGVQPLNTLGGALSSNNDIVFLNSPTAVNPPPISTTGQFVLMPNGSISTTNGAVAIDTAGKATIFLPGVQIQATALISTGYETTERLVSSEDEFIVDTDDCEDCSHCLPQAAALRRKRLHYTASGCTTPQAAANAASGCTTPQAVALRSFQL